MSFNMNQEIFNLFKERYWILLLLLIRVFYCFSVTPIGFVMP